jgi:tRNA-modifying protein YgfZ
VLTLDESFAAARESSVRISWPPNANLLRLTGPQRIWFLQNTITTDVEGVDSGRWVESFLLEPKGKVFAHFRVGILEDEIWLEADSSGVELAERLLSMRFRTKVEIEPQERARSTVMGPGSAPFGAPGETNRDRLSLSFGGALGDVSTVDVYEQDAGAATTLDDVPIAHPDLYDTLRVEAAVPAFGVDYGTENLPQEAGLTRAVSVEKGCYIGQETIARIHFRGHINKVVRPLSLEGLDPGSSIGRDLTLEGRKIGKITSAVTSPTRGPIGLGMVSVDPSEGTVVEVEGGGSAVVGAIPAGTKIKS